MEGSDKEGLLTEPDKSSQPILKDKDAEAALILIIRGKAKLREDPLSMYGPRNARCVETEEPL